MELKIIDIAPEGFMNALNKLLDLPLDMSDSFALASCINILEEKKKVYQTMKDGFFSKWGEKIPNSELTQIKPEHIEEFTKKMEELHAVSFEIPLDKLITLPKEGKIKAIELYLVLKLVKLVHNANS